MYRANRHRTRFFDVREPKEQPNPLFANLTHEWNMEESSGTRYDAVGDMDMWAANSPSRVTGRVGYCVRFPNSPGTSYLYRTTALNPGNNNFHILGWLNWHATDQFGDLEIIVNYSDHYTVATMRFWYNTSAGLYRWSCGGGVPGIYQGRTQGAWVMFDMYFDTVANKSGLALNNGTHTTATAVSYPSTSHPDPALLFASARIGSFQNHNIQLDAIHMWEGHVLTQDERDYMWNSGSGRQLT